MVMFRGFERFVYEDFHSEIEILERDLNMCITLENQSIPVKYDIPGTKGMPSEYWDMIATLASIDVPELTFEGGTLIGAVAHQETYIVSKAHAIPIPYVLLETMNSRLTPESAELIANRYISDRGIYRFDITGDYSIRNVVLYTPQTKAPMPNVRKVAQNT